MSRVEQAILNSVDVALSRLDFIDKQHFYLILESKYGLRRQDIPSCYEVVDTALAETYGVRHQEIRREIVKALHELSQARTIGQIEEANAIAVVMYAFIEKTNRKIDESFRHIETTKTLVKEIEEFTDSISYENGKNTRMQYQASILK